MVTSWSAWSPCSVSCGIGHSMRMRDYIKREYQRECNTTLAEKKSCIPADSRNVKCKDENSLSIHEKRSKLKRIYIL